MLMGLSGAMLSFAPEIDTQLNRRLVRVERPAGAPDIQAMVKGLRAAYPDRVILSMERYGLAETESYPFRLSAPLSVAGQSGRGPPAPALEVFVDPATATILGERPYWTWFRVLKSFHQELFVPKRGETVVGVLGLFLLITVVAGLVLWWRQARRRPAAALRIRFKAPAPMFLRDLHIAGGVYVALFLIMQAATGALVVHYIPAKRLIASLTTGAPPRPAPPRQPGAAGAPVSVNTARDIALAHHPKSSVVQVVFPSPAFDAFSVRLFPTDQPKTQFTRQYLISRSTGRVMMAFDPTFRSPADRLLGSWMVWIHDGNFFGLIGRMILVPTGLMLGLLFPTGLYLYLRRAKMRRGQGS